MIMEDYRDRSQCRQVANELGEKPNPQIGKITGPSCGFDSFGVRFVDFFSLSMIIAASLTPNVRLEPISTPISTPVVSLDTAAQSMPTV